MRRNSDARAIQLGAVNPSAICHSILNACDEVRKEGGGTEQIRKDPAVRLMVHQLAFLCGVDEINDDLLCYGRLTDAVKEERKTVTEERIDDLKLMRETIGMLADRESARLFRRQCQDPVLRFHLYFHAHKMDAVVMEENDERTGEFLAGDWRLASKERLAPSWPMPKARAFIFDTLQKMPMAPRDDHDAFLLRTMCNERMGR